MGEGIGSIEQCDAYRLTQHGAWGIRNGIRHPSAWWLAVASGVTRWHCHAASLGSRSSTTVLWKALLRGEAGQRLARSIRR